MANRVHHPPDLIYPAGTQVVTLVEIGGSDGIVRHPRGLVCVIVREPKDLQHPYRVRFPDGSEESLHRDQVTMLARFKEGDIGGDGFANFTRVYICFSAFSILPVANTCPAASKSCTL